MEQKNRIEIAGKIVEIGETKTFGKFSKKQVVLETDGKYPDYIPFSFKNDAIGLLDGYKAGDVVTICGFVNGRKWVKKDSNGNAVQPPMYFLEVSAASITEGVAASGGDAQASEAEESDPDDMPF